MNKPKKNKSPIITSIETQKNNPQRKSVFLDGKFWKGIDEEILIRFKLEVGKPINKKEIERIIFWEETGKAKIRAVKFITPRMRSRKEIEDRLIKYGYEGRLITKVIQWLESLNYVDDNKFMEMWIKERALKNYGRIRIEQELSQKGFERAEIREKISKIYPDEEEFKRAFEIGKKKLKSFQGLNGASRKRKLWRFLLSRGFSYDLSEEVCRDLISIDNEF